MNDVPQMPLDPDDYDESGNLVPRRAGAAGPIAQCDAHESPGGSAWEAVWLENKHLIADSSMPEAFRAAVSGLACVRTHGRAKAKHHSGVGNIRVDFNARRHVIRGIPLVMLGTGLDEMQLRSCRVVSSRDEIKATHAGPVLCVDEMAWLVRNEVNRLLPGVPGVVRATWISLPFDEENPWMEDLFVYAQSRVGLPLFRPTDFDRCRKLLELEINDKAGAHEILRRMPLVVRDAAYDLSGDETAGLYLFGAKPDSDQLARLQYTAISMDTLRRLHGDAVERALVDSGMSTASYRGRAPAIGAEYVGSCFAPSPESVEEQVHCQTTTCTPAVEIGCGLDEMIAFHNAFAIYSMGLLLWATGIEVTSTGPVELKPIDRVVVVAGKSPAQPARVLPLVDAAWRQWLYYVEHRDNVIRELDLHDAPTWFLLVQDAGCVVWAKPITAQVFSERSRSGLGNDAHRHAIATALYAAGTPADEISAWLGFRALDHDPDALQPAQGAAAARGAIMATIAVHLAAHGWSAIEGMR